MSYPYQKHARECTVPAVAHSHPMLQYEPSGISGEGDSGPSVANEPGEGERSEDASITNHAADLAAATTEPSTFLGSARAFDVSADVGCLFLMFEAMLSDS